MILQAVGEPDWPFGLACGRLIPAKQRAKCGLARIWRLPRGSHTPLLAAGLLTLKEDENKISQTDFELWNDGESISSSSWKVTWYDGYVEVILSEEEQVDEQVILQFDGKKEFQQLFDEE